MIDDNEFEITQEMIDIARESIVDETCYKDQARPVNTSIVGLLFGWLAWIIHRLIK